MESIAKSSSLDFPQASTNLTLRVRQHWPVLLLSLVVLTLYLPVVVGLVHKWATDPNNSHGFLVPVFVGYLIWRKRKELAAAPVCPSTLGTICVLLSVGLLFLGHLGAESFLQRVSLWGMIIGLLLYFVGWPRLRVILFPLAFLVFMIPPPAIIYNQIVLPLQLLTSHFAASCLQVINIVPVSREGNLLVLPNTTLEVVEACSGIRSLMSLLAFAFGYGYLMELSMAIRVLLALGGIPVAIVGNAVRLMITAYLVYHFGPRVVEGFPHALSGAVILMSAALLLFIVHATLVWTQRAMRLQN